MRALSEPLRLQPASIALCLSHKPSLLDDRVSFPFSVSVGCLARVWWRLTDTEDLEQDGVDLVDLAERTASRPPRLPVGWP